MANAINRRATFDVTRVKRLFHRLPKNIQKEVGDGMYKIAKSYQRSLRASLNRNSKRFNKKIYLGIQAKKISNNKSIVKMPQEGEWLDNMRPHLVWLKRGRFIHKWARDKGGALARLAAREGNLYVRPHPFIAEGMANGAKSRQNIMKKVTRLALANS